MSSIAENVSLVRYEISHACQKVGRDPSTVRLLPVTKYVDLAAIQTLIDLGFTEFGESRPQQLIARAQHFSTKIRWHQIGHLQRNKVKQLLPYVSAIHSVDSLRLAKAIDEAAGKLALTPDVLIEVNVTGEESKDGFSLEELRHDWESLIGLSNLRITGLMTMAEMSDSPESARPTFCRLLGLNNVLYANLPEERHLTELSMGMSNDFPVAIEEGATIIRVGSRLFL